MKINEILERLDNVQKCGDGYTAQCPAHNDNRNSLSVKQASDGKILLHCHTGCTCEEIVEAMGITVADLFPKLTAASDFAGISTTETAEYIYTDIDGNVLCKKIRSPGKNFKWQHLENGVWKSGANCKAPLYNQYVTKNSKSVCLVEGEKDVDTLSRHNMPAVSMPNGANSDFQKQHIDFFKDKEVYIIPDNDKPGKKYAQKAARVIADVAVKIKIIYLSEIWEDMPDKADITDFLNTHTTDGISQFQQLTHSTAEWKPSLDNSRIKRLSEIASVQTQWLWFPYIPRGKITILSADPGTGKTFFCLYLAACVSAGRPFYDRDIPNKPECVVYQTAEDGFADTIRPRLDLMNPNLDNIVNIDETDEGLTLSDDVDEIENIMKTFRPALMIFDPLQAYLGAKVDMHRANEVRPVLNRIAHLAEKYDCAVIFIMHHNKLSQQNAIYRTLGSMDIPAISRSMLVMANDPETPGQKIICHEKSSLATHGKSLLFTINDFGVVFNEYSELKADDILSFKKSGRNKPSAAKASAEYELHGVIIIKGYADKDDRQKIINKLGCSEDTLERAKKSLGLVSKSTGFGSEKKTVWTFPDFNSP